MQGGEAREDFSQGELSVSIFCVQKNKHGLVRIYNWFVKLVTVLWRFVRLDQFQSHSC